RRCRPELTRRSGRIRSSSWLFLHLLSDAGDALVARHRWHEDGPLDEPSLCCRSQGAIKSSRRLTLETEAGSASWPLNEAHLDGILGSLEERADRLETRRLDEQVELGRQLRR